MKEEISVPSLGESVTEGILSAWLKKDGEYVTAGDPLFELESDKATLEVPSTVSGLLKTLVGEGTEVEIGRVVATIDTSAVKSAESSSAGKEKKTSPAGRQASAEHGSPAGEIEPTVKEGTPVKESAKGMPAKKDEPPAVKADTPKPENRQERKKMSRIRQRIAENLVQSKQEAAHLTTFNEINMREVLELRKKFQDQFIKAHGIKLGILSFFIKASCLALSKYPEANCFVEGDEIVYNHFYNIGFAVSIEQGLVVPVIKNAETLSLDKIEEKMSQLADKAREKRLSVDDMTGGTFSITNGGIFGSLLSTPIPTPPQSAILGMHAIQERPVAENGEVVIRPMMYVALTYDHRVMDGREAVGFLKSVKESVEEPEKLLLNI